MKFQNNNNRKYTILLFFQCCVDFFERSSGTCYCVVDCFEKDLNYPFVIHKMLMLRVTTHCDTYLLKDCRIHHDGFFFSMDMNMRKRRHNISHKISMKGAEQVGQLHICNKFCCNTSTL